MTEFEIKPVEESQLEKLNETFRSEFDRTHADDLRDQSVGDKLFLVAWLDEEPVGHALVRWLGPRYEVPKKLYPDCPEIYRLGVAPPHQSQGIGTAIIKKCEEAALKKGYRSIGMGTDPDMPIAGNLYYQLGYKKSKAVRYDGSYKRRMDDGSVVTIPDETTFLIKDLRA